VESLSLTGLKKEIEKISMPQWTYNKEEESQIKSLLDSLCKRKQSSECTECDQNFKNAVNNARFRMDVDKIYAVTDSMNNEDLYALLGKLEGNKANFVKAYEDEIKFDDIKKSINDKIDKIDTKENGTKGTGPKEKPTPRKNEQDIKNYVTACSLFSACILSGKFKDVIKTKREFFDNKWCTDSQSNISYLKQFYKDNKNKLTQIEKDAWLNLENNIPTQFQ
jgi:hypothetical protein